MNIPNVGVVQRGIDRLADQILGTWRQRLKVYASTFGEELYAGSVSQVELLGMIAGLQRLRESDVLELPSEQELLDSVIEQALTLIDQPELKSVLVADEIAKPQPIFAATTDGRESGCR